MDEWVLLAGCLAVSSVAFSLYEITMHMNNFTKPHLQRYIIRILLMVPIYSLNAWFAMLLPATGLYLDSMREVYESFVIYSFMKYLMNFLNYETNLQQYIDYKPGPRQIPPLCCLPNCVGGRHFLLRCKHGILQYVIIRPITTVVAFISQQIGIYGEGNYNPLSGATFPVLLLINNASQVTAMYCLVIFYTGFQQELQPMRPLLKFFSIKLVVFFSFFQSVVISGLLEIDMVREILEDVFPNVKGKVALGRTIQELLICFDMLLASMGHLFAFHYKPFTEPDQSESTRALIRDSIGSPNLSPLVSIDQHNEQDQEELYSDQSCCSALCNILDCNEDKRDVSEHFSQIQEKIAQLLSFERSRLPSIVSQQPTDQNSRGGDHPNGPTDGPSQQFSREWLENTRLQETTGDNSTTTPASNGGTERAIVMSQPTSVRNYQSI